MLPELDERDAEIRALNLQEWNKRMEPRVGDFVRFQGGVMRRISYLWGNHEAGRVQTSKGGHYYFGDGYCSFSGELQSGVPLTSLTRSDEVCMGLVWFFHHNFAQAHSSVETFIPCRIYLCMENAPT
jgi:hypothetical protein